MTSLIPYRYEFDYDGNLKTDFQWKKTETLGFWITEITFDSETKEILESKCDCPSCGTNRVSDATFQCKHIKKSHQVFMRTYDAIFCPPKKRTKSIMEKPGVLKKIE